MAATRVGVEAVRRLVRCNDGFGCATTRDVGRCGFLGDRFSGCFVFLYLDRGRGCLPNSVYTYYEAAWLGQEDIFVGDTVHN